MFFVDKIVYIQFQNVFCCDFSPHKKLHCRVLVVFFVRDVLQFVRRRPYYLDKRRFFTRPRTTVTVTPLYYYPTFCGNRGDLSPARELNEVRRRPVNENDRCPGKTATATAQRVNLFPDLLYIIIIIITKHTHTYD